MSSKLPVLRPTAIVTPRRVVNLFGLPFDALTLDETVAAVRQACAKQRRLFLSTANVNFVVHAQRDPAFRQSLRDSDLCVADGAPIVWISRLLGRPLPERVAGADVFEALRRRDDAAPVSVYLFGGPPGAAERASQVLNDERGGMRCVGYACPGFGSVDSMSTPEILERINRAKPQFVIVALGAVKGQTWIQRNRLRLDAAVISHLGAVVNFAAGRISRAPAWVARTGFEWAWRIAHEPALWRRYAFDGAQFVSLVWREVRRSKK